MRAAVLSSFFGFLRAPSFGAAPIRKFSFMPPQNMVYCIGILFCITPDCHERAGAHAVLIKEEFA
jgi:hypothetical protein